MFYSGRIYFSALSKYKLDNIYAINKRMFW